MAAVAVIARETVIFAALITAKFIAAVAVRVQGCDCYNSDTSDDVAAFAVVIVSSCCWECCGCCCSDSKDNCDFCCMDTMITAKFSADVAVSAGL